ncbi:unnamed protein product [Eretmochelys imbricata]
MLLVFSHTSSGSLQLVTSSKSFTVEIYPWNGLLRKSDWDQLSFGSDFSVTLESSEIHICYLILISSYLGHSAHSSLFKKKKKKKYRNNRICHLDHFLKSLRKSI